MRSTTFTLLLALFASLAVGTEAQRPFIDEGEAPVPSSVQDKDLSWKEQVTALPPWPRDADLVEFEVDDPTSLFRHYIDGKHLQLGKDGAIRYTLVVESPNGARNISVERMRCTPRGTYRMYAYGNQGRFEKSDTGWTEIQESEDKLHRDLHRFFLCVPMKFQPRPQQDIIRIMRARVPHEKGTGFLPE